MIKAAVLYDVDVRTINYHLRKVFKDSELAEESVIRKFRITAADGKNYDTGRYNLSAIVQDRLFVSYCGAQVLGMGNEEGCAK